MKPKRLLPSDDRDDDHKSDHSDAQLDGGAEEMTATGSDLLMIQFLRWVTEHPRTYVDVMEAWRTSCPRLSIWEDAQADGLVQTDGKTIMLTTRGLERLRSAQNPVFPS